MSLPCYDVLHVTIQDGTYIVMLQYSITNVLVLKYIGILTLVYMDDLSVEFTADLPYDDSDFYAYLTLKCPSHERVDSAVDLFNVLADEL